MPIGNSSTYRQRSDRERAWQAAHGHYSDYGTLDLDTAHELRLARERLDLSLRQVARQARISPSYLSRLERGLRAPRVATAMRLRRVLDLDEELVERLIGDAERR